MLVELQKLQEYLCCSMSKADLVVMQALALQGLLMLICSSKSTCTATRAVTMSNAVTLM